MRRIAAGVAIALSCLAAAFAQPSSTPLRRLDTWSGLIFLCEMDAKLAVRADLCAGINAEAARQAAAAKIKFVALAPGDGESGKIAKAKAAKFADKFGD